jgi:hypothetical protein
MMAATITLGLAIAVGTPAFAGAGSTQLPGTRTSIVRNAPTVPASPVHVKGGQINDGRQTRSLCPTGLDGTWVGVLQTLALAMLH